MRIVIQRVTAARVEVGGEIVGQIGSGLLVLVGVTHADTAKQAVALAQKLVHLRIFSDELGKMNLSLLQTSGSALIVSQFTLYGDCNEGRRPSWVAAARPEIARPLYEQFIEEVKKQGVTVETGVFGAQMEVSLTNSGPITLLCEA